MCWLEGFSKADIIVVGNGHRLYKEDGTDDFLEVTPGNPVISGSKIYMTESDYHKIAEFDYHKRKDHLGVSR